MVFFESRGIFAHITDYVNNKKLSAFEAYELFLRLCAETSQKFDTYGSTSITSGGHARLKGGQMEEKIQKNTTTCRLLAAELAEKGQINPKSIILPVDLGKIDHWGQSDYMFFWLLVIARPHISAPTYLERHVADELRKSSTNTAVMDDGNLNPEERAQHYFSLCNDMYRVLSDYKTDLVQKIIRMVDPSTSLGAQAERYFARLSSIPVYNIVAVSPAKDIDFAIQNTHLKQDNEQIIKYGGTMVHVASGEFVTLELDTHDELPNKDAVIASSF